MAYAPQITEIVLKSLGRRQGPAIDNATNDAISRFKTGEFARMKAAEDAGGRLGLAQESLANRTDISTQRLASSDQRFRDTMDFESGRFDTNQDVSASRHDTGLSMDKRWHDQGLAENAKRFNTDLGFRRDRMNYGRRAGNLATLASAMELGISGLEAHKNHQRSMEKKRAVDKIIESYQGAGDDRNQTTARLLELMRID